MTKRWDQGEDFFHIGAGEKYVASVAREITPTRCIPRAPESPRPPKPLTIADVAKDAVKLVLFIGLPSFLIVAHFGWVGLPIAAFQLGMLFLFARFAEWLFSP